MLLLPPTLYLFRPPPTTHPRGSPRACTQVNRAERQAHSLGPLRAGRAGHSWLPGEGVENCFNTLARHISEGTQLICHRVCHSLCIQLRRKPEMMAEKTARALSVGILEAAPSYPNVTHFATTSVLSGWICWMKVDACFVCERVCFSCLTALPSLSSVWLFLPPFPSHLLHICSSIR